MGLLAQHQLPELDSVFHSAVFSKVLVILMRCWLPLRKVCQDRTWSLALFDWWSVCWDIYPVLMALELDCLTIAVISIPEGPLDSRCFTESGKWGSWRQKLAVEGPLSPSPGRRRFKSKQHCRSKENPGFRHQGCSPCKISIQLPWAGKKKMLLKVCKWNCH